MINEAKICENVDAAVCHLEIRVSTCCADFKGVVTVPGFWLCVSVGRRGPNGSVLKIKINRLIATNQYSFL